jgi:hypothetical protein
MGDALLSKDISRHWRIRFEIISTMLMTQLAVAPLVAPTFLNRRVIPRISLVALHAWPLIMRAVLSGTLS